MIDLNRMIELNNWLLELYGATFASLAAAITVLLTVLYLILVMREWTKGR